MLCSYKSYMVDCKLLQSCFESRIGCMSGQFRLLHFVLILDMCSLLFRLVASMMQEERSQFSRFYFLSCLSTYFVATSCHALCWILQTKVSACHLEYWVMFMCILDVETWIYGLFPYLKTSWMLVCSVTSFIWCNRADHLGALYVFLIKGFSTKLMWEHAALG